MRLHARTFWCCFTLAGIVAGTGGVAAQGGADASPAALRNAPWRTVAASGQVEAHPPEAATEVWRAVARGDQLLPQTSVRTGRKGRATLARNGSILIVDRDSRVDLPCLVEAGASPSSVTQTQGRVVYKIEKRDSRHFEVVTPYLVAGVKGTTFMVTVKDHTASVSVREGVVEVASAITGEKQDVHAGETVLLGDETATRMEVVSTRPGEDTGRDRKTESAERARDDAARMTRLLDAQDPAGDAVGAQDPRIEVQDPAGTALGETGTGLGALADDVTQGAAGPRETDPGLDPLANPIDSLPVDARPDPRTGAVDPSAPPEPPILVDPRTLPPVQDNPPSLDPRLLSGEPPRRPTGR